jgi:hypothetical protein
MRSRWIVSQVIRRTVALGRDRELADVVERMRNGVLLPTLTGPGATGKNRPATLERDLELLDRRL